MIKNYEYLLYKRFFLSRKNEGYISLISWLSLIGISLGVAVLIIVMSVMNGFREELVSKVVGVNGHLNIFSQFNEINENDFNLIKKNKKLEKININPIIETQGLLISEKDSKGIFIRGVDSNYLIERKDFINKIIQGRIFSNNSNEIIIGSQLANLLDLRINDKVKIAIPKTDNTLFGNIPRFKTLIISGIFNLGVYEYDLNFAFIPMSIGQNILSLKENQFNNIEIFIKNPEEVEEYKNLLSDFFYNNNLNYLYAITWKDLNKSFLEALKIERNVMFLILTLIIIIASMNIISGLVIFVKDKSADIGILRTFGLSKGSLIKIFILIGSTIGIIGTLLGVLIGTIFCLNIKKIQLFLEQLFDINLFSQEVYYLATLPARINYYEVLFIIIITLIITFLSTIYPAIKSSNIDPIKVIRNE